MKQLGELITGRTPSTKRKDFYDGGYNLISPADLDNGKYVQTAHKRLTKLGFKQCRALPKDTVLVGCIGNIGKLGMVGDEQSATNQQINALICNSDNDPEFIYYCFHENRERLESRAVKTTVPILNKTNFGNFELNIPPLAEQKNIAHILSTVQQTIEAQERIIQVTTELKKALMHKLFTKGLRNESQKQTEIGPVPESWEESTLGDIALFSTGGTPSRKKKEFWEGGTIPWVKTGEINYRPITATEESITERGMNESNAKLFPKGTLLIAMYGQGITRGRVGLLGIDATTNQACAAIKPYGQNKIKTEYLYFFLEYFYEELRSRGHGANQKNLSMTLLKMFPVAFPDENTQGTIVTALKSLDAKVVLAMNRTASYKDLFCTLLHCMMTAKTRVHKF